MNTTAQDLTIRRWEEAAAIARPLTLPEREALATDIAARGVIYPVMVLPDGRIVDGHHRWELSDGQARITVLPPMTDDEALYLAGQLNIARRHLDRAEWDSLFNSQVRRASAVAMLAVKTQAEVAKLFGVSQSSVASWKRTVSTDTLSETDNTSIPTGKTGDQGDPERQASRPYKRVKDHREKLTDLERKDIARRYWKGEPPGDVATRFNVTERTVRRIANAATRTPQTKAPTAPGAESKKRTPEDEAPVYQRVTRSRRVYSFDDPLTAPVGASLKGWSATILSIIEFTKALRDQGVRPLVRQWSPRQLEVTLANLDVMIGQIQQLRAEVAAAILPDDPDPDGPG
jgi:DNA-directed RNA polymerase specialized sigma24 family protein